MTRRAVPVLAVVLVSTLASASAAVVIRRGQRAYCSEGVVQYEYEAPGWFNLNSYADVYQRLCLGPRGADAQFVDVQVEVTVQMETSRNDRIFEADSTWAKVEINVDGLVTTHRCLFPELSRMTPYQLNQREIGPDGPLAKHCRYAVPPGDRVTVQTRFYGVERTTDDPPLSGPLTVSRDGDGTSCKRGRHDESCARIDL